MVAAHYLGASEESVAAGPWASLRRTLERLNAPFSGILRESASGPGMDIELARLLRRAREAVEHIAREDHLETQRAALVDALERAGAATYASLCDAGADAAAAAAAVYFRRRLPSSVPEAQSTNVWASLGNVLDLLGAPLPEGCNGYDIEKALLMRRFQPANGGL